MRPRLLVTGFGRFPGVSVNPSAEVARRVAASPRWRRLGIEAEALVMPTAYAAIEAVLAPALDADMARPPGDADHQHGVKATG